MAQFRIASSITMLIGILLITAMPLSKPLAAPNASESTPAKDSPANPSLRSQANPDEQKPWLEKHVPVLEQTLIIFTSVNAVLLVVGGIAYGMKLRMENESANTLAAIKDRQDHS